MDEAGQAWRGAAHGPAAGAPAAGACGRRGPCPPWGGGCAAAAAGVPAGSGGGGGIVLRVRRHQRWHPAARAAAGSAAHRCRAGPGVACASSALAAWSWVVLQAIAGGDSDAEVASLILWVFGWVGLALVSALLGPAWTLAGPLHHPLRPAHAAWRAAARCGPASGPSAAKRHGVSDGRAAPTSPRRAWPAAPVRVAGRGLPGRLRLARAGGPRRGRTTPGPRPRGIHADDARGHGLVRPWCLARAGRGLQRLVRPPGSPGALRARRPPSRGAAATTWVRQRPRAGPWPDALLALVAVGAGSVIWDGISQTRPWTDLVGRPGLVGESLLLAAFLAGLAWLVLRVARAVGPAAMGAGLVPVTTGYVVAHYLGFLLVEGQRIVVAASDPLQQGWDLFGTASVGAPRRLAVGIAAVDRPGRRRRPGACRGRMARARSGQARASRGAAVQPVAPGRAHGRAHGARPLVARPEPRLRRRGGARGVRRPSEPSIGPTWSPLDLAA